MPPLEDSAACGELCFHAHQSLSTLFASTWCAAVLLPHRKAAGKSMSAPFGGSVTVIALL